MANPRLSATSPKATRHPETSHSESRPAVGLGAAAPSFEPCPDCGAEVLRFDSKRTGRVAFAESCVDGPYRLMSPSEWHDESELPWLAKAKDTAGWANASPRLFRLHDCPRRAKTDDDLKMLSVLYGDHKRGPKVVVPASRLGAEPEVGMRITLHDKNRREVRAEIVDVVVTARLMFGENE